MPIQTHGQIKVWPLYMKKKNTWIIPEYSHLVRELFYLAAHDADAIILQFFVCRFNMQLVRFVDTFSKKNNLSKMNDTVYITDYRYMHAWELVAIRILDIKFSIFIQNTVNRKMWLDVWLRIGLHTRAFALKRLSFAMQKSKVDWVIVYFVVYENDLCEWNIHGFNVRYKLILA